MAFEGRGAATKRCDCSALAENERSKVCRGEEVVYDRRTIY